MIKVAIKKIQLSTLTTVFSILSQTDSLLYSLLVFKYYFSFFFSIILPTLNKKENIKFSHIICATPYEYFTNSTF
jgi:hypothetical protein